MVRGKFGPLVGRQSVSLALMVTLSHRGRRALRPLLESDRRAFLILHRRSHEHPKTPPPKRRGWSIRFDQSPLRRDQISVKLSSPSPLTSEA
jgi:hypothetical protein